MDMRVILHRAREQTNVRWESTCDGGATTGNDGVNTTIGVADATSTPSISGGCTTTTNTAAISTSTGTTTTTTAGSDSNPSTTTTSTGTNGSNVAITRILEKKTNAPLTPQQLLTLRSRATHRIPARKIVDKRLALP